MSEFNKKTWVDRNTEYPDRRTLHIVNDDGTFTNKVATIERNEGTIYSEGTKLDADNMNDLEDRIADGFDAMQPKLVAGNNITFTSSSTGLKISATDSKYYGNGAVEISDSNVITVRTSSLYPAGPNRLGVVKPGHGLKVTEDGTLELDLINADNTSY